MNDKIVLICATGRSGSTTMMRLINTIPDSNICGENFAAINSLLEFYRRVKKSTMNNIPGHLKPFSYDCLVSNNIKPAWYKMMIINMFKNKETTTLWGFKEIRYDSGDVEYLKDFKELFPQTKVIIQVRENIENQSKSGWFKNDSNAVNFLKKTSKQLAEFAIQNKEWCYLTSFERMFDRNNLYNIFSFIDCRGKYDENKITEVLNNNIKDT